MAATKFDLLARDGLATSLLDVLPVAAYTTDRDGYITFANQAAAAFAGRQPVVGSDRWCVSWRLYHVDGTPLRHEDCPMAVALKENRIIRGIAAIAERPDGRRVRFLPFPTPLCDDAGTPVGGINILVDLGQHSMRSEQEPGPAATTLLAMFEVMLQDVGRQARGAEARRMLDEISHRTAALSTICMLFGGLTERMRSSDILTAACVAAQRQLLPRCIETKSESDASDFEVGVALPLVLIASELIVAVAGSQSAEQELQVTAELRQHLDGPRLTVVGQGPSRRRPLQPPSQQSLISGLARLIDASIDITDTGFQLQFAPRRILH